MNRVARFLIGFLFVRVAKFLPIMERSAHAVNSDPCIRNISIISLDDTRNRHRRLSDAVLGDPTYLPSRFGLFEQVLTSRGKWDHELVLKMFDDKCPSFCVLKASA
jgi:hypothetical protein